MNTILETGDIPIMLFLPVELPSSLVADFPNPPSCRAAPTHDDYWLYFLKGFWMGRLVGVVAVLPDPDTGPIRLPTPAELAAAINCEGRIEVNIFVQGLFVQVIQRD